MGNNTAVNIKKTVADLLKNTSVRNKDIISRRFGLKTGQKETLESIGASYGITRERVRQIEESTLTQLRLVAADHSDVKRYIVLARDILNERGGVIQERDLFKSFSGSDSDNVNNSSLVFLLSLSNELARLPENDDFNSFWAVSNATLTSFTNTADSLVKVLEKVDRVVSNSDFAFLAQKHDVPSFSTTGKPLSEADINLVMAISKNLGSNIFNEVGLASWSEIKPKGVRDKAFLVLKKSTKPQHFSDIASLINASGFNNKKANVQTVHNELIKDDRFILVGRGMYALSEWGYRAGTVKDVLMDVLKSSTKPMTRIALIAKVKDARMVKENTILLNLQDSKTFVKNPDGTYDLKK